MPKSRPRTRSDLHPALRVALTAAVGLAAAGLVGFYGAAALGDSPVMLVSCGITVVGVAVTALLVAIEQSTRRR